MADKPVTREEKYLAYLTDKGVGLDIDADGYVSLKATEGNNND